MILNKKVREEEFPQTRIKHLRRVDRGMVMTAKKNSDSKNEPEKPAETTEVVGPKKVGSQTFDMIRHFDESGISGTGVVAEGIVFSTGKCVVTFIGDGAMPSVIVWDSFEQFRKIHIDMHPNNDTELVWYDKRKRPKK